MVVNQLSQLFIMPHFNIGVKSEIDDTDVSFLASICFYYLNFYFHNKVPIFKKNSQFRYFLLLYFSDV